MTSQTAVDRLAAMVRGLAQRTTCVLYLPRQDRLAVSKASTTARGVGSVPASVFPEVVGGDGSLIPYYDYRRLIDRYAHAFGPEHLRVRTIRRDGRGVDDVVDDFVGLLSVETDRFDRPRRRNRALEMSASGLAAYSLLTDRYGRLAEQFTSRSLQRVLAELDPGSGFRSRIGREDARRFMLRFEQENRLIAERLDLEHDLFDDDYSEYPEAAGTADEGALIELLTRLVGIVGEDAVRARAAIAPTPPHAQADVTDSAAHRSPRAVLHVDARAGRRLVAADLERFVVFDEGWRATGQTGRRTTSATAQMWMLVANPKAPRTIAIDLDIDHRDATADEVALSVTSGVGPAATASGTGVLVELPSGYSRIQLTTSLGGAESARASRRRNRRSREILLRGISLRWK